MDQNNDLQLTRRNVLTGLIAGALSLTPLAALARSKNSATKPARWNEHMELAVNVELNLPEGFRVHRPYIAVWVEDAQGNSIRTLSLWVQMNRKGGKWIPDLRRWWRGEQARQAKAGGDLVSTVSSATRVPGKYTLIWDGKDDSGKLVAQGNYSVFIEAARDHGTYQLMKQDVVIGKKPFAQNLVGNIEVKGASVEYRKRA